MNYNEIIQKIQDTEIILVGIGEELAFPYQKEEKEIIWEKILEYKSFMILLLLAAKTKLL